MAFLFNYLFFRQFWALCRKNWIVLSKHWFLNLLRCLAFPIAYGVFLSQAGSFLSKPNNYGLGTPAPLATLASVFDPSLPIIWSDGTNTSSSTHPSPADVMNLVIQGLRPEHRSSVRRVNTTADIFPACPQNFNRLSECFAAVSFENFPTPPNNPITNTPLAPQQQLVPAFAPLLASPPNGTSVLNPNSLLNYTIHIDAGLQHVDVINHSSDFEIRVFPLQWAIDSAIIQLITGRTPPTPLEWPYSIETNSIQSTNERLSFIRGIKSLLVVALFINFVGISYHLPGSYVTERSTGLTSHLRAMGLKDLPRLLSWHFSISLAYLPAWIVSAVIWQNKIFSGTNVGIIIVMHILTGLSLGSYSFFVALPALSPSLSASISTFLAIIFAVLGLVLAHASTAAASLLVLIFPPSFFVFATRAIAGFEEHQFKTSLIARDPDGGVMLLPLFVTALIDIFLYPILTVWLERRFYDARDAPSSKSSWLRPFRRASVRVSAKGQGNQAIALTDLSNEAPAIVIKNLVKKFPTSMLPIALRPWRWFSRRPDTDADAVTAIADLSFSVPRGGIFVLLGSNGAGKSTSLSILAGLLGRSGGSVVFPPVGATSRVDDKEGATEWEGPSRPPKGAMGIVPQKNVLFPELSCFQTMQLWSAVKRPSNRATAGGYKRHAHVETTPEELERLLIDCGLEGKVHANAGSLSGGQKRKLQLAIGLVGGSEIVLVDECTSGVDPLSRRSIWRTLTSVKNERTIVFTTHFLDEADLLADNIAILAAPGKLVAEGSPVALKSRLGRGYTLQATFENGKKGPDDAEHLLRRIRDIATDTTLTSTSPNGSAYCLQSKDSRVVKQVLETLQAEKTKFGIASYEIHGTAIEDIFLDLMSTEGAIETTQSREKMDAPLMAGQEDRSGLQLTSGRKKSPLSQSLTIFYKRCLIMRHSWLSSLLTVGVAVAGACIPLTFITNRSETCLTTFTPAVDIPLYIGNSPFSSVLATELPGSQARLSPPGLLSMLGISASHVPFTDVSDNATFVNIFKQNSQNLSLGGVSIDFNTNVSLFAWEASPPGYTGATMLNLITNIMYNQALNATGRSTGSPSIIAANYQNFPAANVGTLNALKWVAIFGATMAVFPAFFAMYVSLERRSSVQAMQFSNGLTNPAGLWLGHLLFDGILGTILATFIIIVFAAASTQFHGAGYLWLVLVLYGFAAALFSYCFSLFTSSPLAAFAAVAGYQAVMFIVYLAGYLVTVTYAKNSQTAGFLTIINFTLSLLSPVASVMRAALVSINLFSLLCTNGTVNNAVLGNILKFGGPILYLIVECFVFFGILVYVDSGSVLPRWLQFMRPPSREADSASQDQLGSKDVTEEINAVENSETDLLRVLHVSKTFDRSPKKAVDDVSFGVSRDTVFAMLGPNGAGKTSTFNIIRGDINPDSGDVFINGTSIIAHPNTARLSLGVCPQFTAIDPELTVRQHLIIYGMLKGLQKGPELEQNVETLLRATTLTQYADRLAIKLSGGNQRKLSFAIALIGNPTVILIDEYSTGIDAATKRSMWVTFRRMAVGKAVVITTHSMEEASALANKVGILAGRMLAVGTTDSLASRYALYEVHFPARTRDEIVKAQQLMARIPGSRMADDVATRFEVPIRSEHSSGQEEDAVQSESTLSLSQLFETLSSQSDFPEYTVERISLESVFLKVIREHNIKEEDTIAQIRQQANRRGILRFC